jgi:hypothetical protein
MTDHSATVQPTRPRPPATAAADAEVATWRRYQSQGDTAQRRQHLAVVAANDRLFSQMKG